MAITPAGALQPAVMEAVAQMGQHQGEEMQVVHPFQKPGARTSSVSLPKPC